MALLTGGFAFILLVLRLARGRELVSAQKQAEAAPGITSPDRYPTGLSIPY
jgi:hypothetical protein